MGDIMRQIKKIIFIVTSVLLTWATIGIMGYGLYFIATYYQKWLVFGLLSISGILIVGFLSIMIGFIVGDWWDRRY
jgi:hypothetical protein